ncbi:unnamed protein product [Bursaphelenchus okinawaensis]|uniref:F-box domain-containing protein n=1 Tax=Bursaphelenchus okinawaensis TaxID=465554 RepID=A0A811K8E8_9BILA|nr:unnamed protein product [Bursaphelenchus okinawaensis]CAG9093999.1 unnamed protein product [Bursaphelenchus okinawaensis]
MISQRRKFFEDLIEKEKIAKAQSLARIRPRRKVVIPKYVKPSNLPVELPDKALSRIFNYLDYKDQCRVERVSKKWQRLVLHKQCREIKELVVESTGSSLQALQQTAFYRLSVSASRECVEALSGIVRRCPQLERLTCDISLLCTTSKIEIVHQKYFNTVESLWLVVAKCHKNMLAKIERVEKVLFTSLQTLTLQVHVSEDTMDMIAQLVSIFTARRPNLILNLEIHASSGSKIAQQINCLQDIKVNKLKLVCSALNCALLSVPLISESLHNSKVSFRNVSFREWYITFDDKTPISQKPLRKLSFNSCTVYRSDELVEAIYITWSQKNKKRKKEGDTVTPDSQKMVVTKRKCQNPDKKASKTRSKLEYLKKLEMTGSCTVVDLNHMNKKAHIELSNRISAKCPTLTIDTSDIYY